MSSISSQMNRETHRPDSAPLAASTETVGRMLAAAMNHTPGFPAAQFTEDGAVTITLKSGKTLVYRPATE